MDALLQVSGFSLRIGSQPVTENVSFSVWPGERVAIVGESGSGKTVTALSLLGLQPGRIASGKALFRMQNGDTVDLFSVPGNALHRLRGKAIGYVFQEPGMCLNPSLRCGKQLAEVIRFHTGVSRKEARVQAWAAFTRVGLTESERIYESYPHQLSGGQKQRVMLAIAMAPKPKLLVADEPTTALDVSLQKQITELLHTLCRENGTALLFITHDLALAGHMATRILVMHRGKTVEEGPSESVLSTPREAYTQKLVQARIGAGTAPLPKEGHTSETLVSVRNLSAGYRDRGLFLPKAPVPALTDLSFDIRRGETLGLVGESGSGKSTLAQVLMALKMPDSGTVELFGKNLFALPSDELRRLRKRFRIIFQDPYASFNPKLNVGSQIAETMAVYGLYDHAKGRAEKTAEWLQRVGLQADDARRLPHTFSGGQRQRIAVARALACGPDFLVCDECVSSLDVSLQREILDLLAGLQAETGMGMLFISHDPHVVHFLCENTLLLKDGRAVAYGPTRSLWQNPGSPYLRQLLAAVL